MRFLDGREIPEETLEAILQELCYREIVAQETVDGLTAEQQQACEYLRLAIHKISKTKVVYFLFAQHHVLVLGVVHDLIFLGNS